MSYELWIMSYELWVTFAKFAQFAVLFQLSNLNFQALVTSFFGHEGAVQPQMPSKMRGEGWVSGARMWALERVKGAGRRGAEGVLWPFRGGFGCFLSRFWGLASGEQRVWWCRISLFVCLLGKFDWLVSRQTTVRQFNFWGVQFPSFLIYISIY